MKGMDFNKIRENVSFQTCLVIILLLVEVVNYVSISNKVEQICKELDILKRREPIKSKQKGDLTDCCSKFRTHDRYRKSLTEMNYQTFDTPVNSNNCQKGDKGAKGIRGPLGLPGLKGESGSCGCFTTAEPETAPPPTIEPRQYDCQIKKVGIPLHQAEYDTYWGFWSKDAYKNSPFKQYYWLTNHFEGRFLHAYENLEDIKSSNEHLLYDLSPSYFFGTGHVVFNGSFIYHEAGSSKLNKFDLDSKEITASVVLPQASFSGNFYLYSGNYTYFDLAVDENGLWVVYTSSQGTHDLVVSNLDPNDLRVRVTWNIPARSKDYDESFIVCGRLYLIKSTSTTSCLDSIYDLYTEEWLERKLKFKNPYELNAMVSYNPIDKNVYSWNKGHLLIYPLLME